MPDNPDLQTLTNLNADYIRSVQNSDVARFDQILADDFLCSNPDGSLVERAAFLEQVALPAKISNLEAHDLKVRIISDTAIITRRRAISRPTGDRAPGAIPTSGHVGTGGGCACPRTSRAGNRAIPGLGPAQVDRRRDQFKDDADKKCRRKSRRSMTTPGPSRPRIAAFPRWILAAALRSLTKHWAELSPLPQGAGIAVAPRWTDPHQ